MDSCNMIMINTGVYFVCLHFNFVLDCVGQCVKCTSIKVFNCVT